MVGQHYRVFCKTCNETIKGQKKHIPSCDMCISQAMNNETHWYECGLDNCIYYEEIRKHIDNGHNVVRAWKW